MESSEVFTSALNNGSAKPGRKLHREHLLAGFLTPADPLRLHRPCLPCTVMICHRIEAL